MEPASRSSEIDSDGPRTKGQPPKGIITRNVKLLGVGLLAWSVYYAFTGSPAVAVGPFLCTVAGLLLTFRLQPRPGDPVEKSPRLAGRALALRVVGGVLGVAGSLPVVLGGLLLTWNGFRTAVGGTSYTPLSWSAVLTTMSGAWLLSVIGMWLTDQAEAIGRTQAKPSAEGEPRE